MNLSYNIAPYIEATMVMNNTLTKQFHNPDVYIMLIMNKLHKGKIYLSLMAINEIIVSYYKF